MSDNNNRSDRGISFLGALSILFLGLKLCGVITWSWWWVFAPFWGPCLFAVILGGIALVIYLTREGE